MATTQASEKMVGMASSFGTYDLQTPHGGPPFQGWRRGFGFGYAKGSGGAVLDPSVPHQLRFTPVGERAMASSAFWRRRSEVGQATGFGIGDRPQLAHLAGASKDTWVAPNSYGDTSRVLEKTRQSATRSNITLKPRFPTAAEKYKLNCWPLDGPGPGKYDCRGSTGESTRAYTINPRLQSQAHKEAMGKPGPGDHHVAIIAGKTSPIRKGTLYDISLGPKLKNHAVGANLGPGPAKYNIEGCFDKYGLAQKIANAKVTKLPTKSKKHEEDEEDLPPIAEEEEEGAKKLSRVASSPN